MKIISVLLALMFLVSCNSIIPLDLSKVDLEPILILPDDLPNELEEGQVQEKIEFLVAKYDDFPEPDYRISQQFYGQDFRGGFVNVLLYKDHATLDMVYNSLIESDLGWEESLPRDYIGEDSRALTKNTLDGDKAFVIVFTRCQAVIYIWGFDKDDAGIFSYADKLDQRIEKEICR